LTDFAATRIIRARMKIEVRINPMVVLRPVDHFDAGTYPFQLTPSPEAEMFPRIEAEAASLGVGGLITASHASLFTARLEGRDLETVRTLVQKAVDAVVRDWVES